MARNTLTRVKILAQSALETFLLDCEARRLSAKTLSFYQQQLNPFVAYLTEQGITRLDTLDAATIRAYLVTLQERGLSGTSQHCAARSIRAWLNFCVAEQLLTSTPMANVRMPKMDSELLESFTKSDVDALIKACKESAHPLRDEALLLVMLDSGVRASELIALTWGDVNLKTGSITVRHGKGAKDRVTFIGVRARKTLLKYRATLENVEASTPLLANLVDGKALRYDGLKEVFRRLGRRANVSNCHPHTTRRTFAVWSLKSGMNIFALQQLMGHESLDVLKRYLKLTESDLEQAHRQYGAVDALLG